MATEFQKVTSKIIKAIKKKNDQGRYYPLLATCLGFESLIISENGDDPNIMKCDFEDEHKNHTIKINEIGLKESKIWSSLYTREEINRIFDNQIVYYTHHCGFTPKDFLGHKTLPQDYHLIGTSTNDKGVEFLASIEHKKYPIIGNQWHPEKNQFERTDLYSFLDRSVNTVMFMSKMISGIVEKVRPTAKAYSEIPAAIKPYFSVYRNSEALAIFSYERIYTFERNSYDKTT